MLKNPPKLPLRIFKYFCSEERLEELEGDLFEVYNEYLENKGERFSTLFYWWIVIRSFRSYALKRTKMKKKRRLTSVLTFLNHNLKISWRNLLKYRSTSLINITGLAIGISGFLTIYSIISFELDFDQHISDRDHIYRITTEFTGVFQGTNRGTVTGLPTFIDQNCPIVEEIVFFQSWVAPVKVARDPSGFSHFDRNRRILFTDSSFFQMFDQYTWLAGSIEQFSRPNALILEKRQAEKYFPGGDFGKLLNQEVLYEDSLRVFIAGVVERSEDRTDFDFTDFISHSTIEKNWIKERFIESGNWDSFNSGTQVFIKVNRNAQRTDLEEMLSDINAELKKHETVPEWTTRQNLEPLSNIHFSSLGIFDHSRSSVNLRNLYLLMILALALLVIAICNFINLETAQATNNVREVGLRKVMGSNRLMLFGRFFTSSALITFIAALLSLPIAATCLSFFEEFVPQGVGLDILGLGFWLVLIGLLFGITILSGTYPALVISSFAPIDALKIKMIQGGNRAGGLVRKLLISFQFVIAQVLIVGTLAIVSQISFMLNKDLGFTKEGVIYIRTPWLESAQKQQRLYQDLKGIPQLSLVSYHGDPPASPGYSTSTMSYVKDTSKVVTNINRKFGDSEYLNLYGIELLAGTNIQKNESFIEAIINETAMKEMGILDPIDAVGLKLENGENRYQVVGVCKDFHISSLRHQIPATMISYMREMDGNGMIGMKVQLEDIQGTVALISGLWESVYPNATLEVKFFDEEVGRFYDEEQRTSKLATTATIIAIFISCLGLFGLISFVIANRSKEVGIRKVLGASLMQISSVISKEFVLLIALSFLLATPLAYYFIGEWMDRFVYRTPIAWWMYLLGGLLSMFIAIVSVGTRILKAANANPIDSLRYE